MRAARHRRPAPPTVLEELAFWLVVMAVVAGMAALMWSTATGGL
jgi:hypothetical protein